MMIPLDALLSAAGGGEAASASSGGGPRPAGFRALLDGLLATSDAGAEPDALLDELEPFGTWQDDEGSGPELSWPGLTALLGTDKRAPAQATTWGAPLEDLLADPDVDVHAAALLARVDPDELEAALALAELVLPAGEPDPADDGEVEPDGGGTAELVEPVAVGDPEVIDGADAPPTDDPETEPAPQSPASEPEGEPRLTADTTRRMTADHVPGRPSREPAVPGSRPATGDSDPPRVSSTSAATTDPSVTAEPAATATARPAPAPAPSRPVGLPAAVERVLDAVAELEHAPPPRQLTLDLGEARVRVALEDGQVRLTLLDADRGGQDLLDEAADALAQQGFDLARDGDGRGGDRDGPASPDGSTTDPTSARARRLRATGGLRL